MSFAGRIKSDANSEGVEDGSFGTLSADSICKGFAVGISSWSLSFDTSTVVVEVEASIARGAKSVALVVGEAQGINCDANALKVEDSSFGTLFADSIFKYFTVGISGRLGTFNTDVVDV